MTRTGWMAVIAALVLAGAGGWVLRGPPPASEPRADSHDQGDDVAYYTCPMHPSVRASEPGACPICGMDLTPGPKANATQLGDHNFDGAVVPSEFVTLTQYQQQLIGVTIGEVNEQSVEAEVRTIGRVVYDETRLADVNLKVSGWIQKLFVDHVGKSVKRGEPLFTLYSPELVASQEEYLLAYQRQKRLRVAANRDNETVPNQSVAWNERLLQSTRERLQLWDMTESQIEMLELSGERQIAVTVYSPTAGIVMERIAVSGMFVKPDTRLYRIANVDSVWINADVYERELPFVHEGQQATFSLSYLPRQGMKGVVDFVYPYLNAKTRTATVRIRAANLGGHLRPDTFVDVQLHQSPGVRLTVPEAAILFSGRRRIVFLVLGEGRFQPREVSLGRRFQSGYEVLSGLQSGDRVVTSGNFLLDSESKLKNVIAGMHRMRSSSIEDWKSND